MNKTSDNKSLLLNLLRQCLLLLDKYNNCLTVMSNNCKCDQNIENKLLFNDLLSKYKSLIINNSANSEIIEKIKSYFAIFDDLFETPDNENKTTRDANDCNIEDDNNSNQTIITEIKEENSDDANADINNCDLNKSEHFDYITNNFSLTEKIVSTLDTNDHKITATAKNVNKTVNSNCEKLSASSSPVKPRSALKRKRKKWTKHVISAKNICIDFKTNATQYHCPYNGCDYITMNRKTLYTHTRNKHTDETFECHVCGKVMASINSLRIHSKTVHTDKRPFKCDKCDARFKLSCYVKRHEEEVHGDLKFTCDWPECHYKTTTKLNLERHTISHTNVRSFRCDWPACDLAFGRKSTLNAHIKAVHEDEKFYCSLCDLVFKKKHSLQVHIMHQHTNERPFMCEKCHKGFAAKHILNKHLKIHLEKPYKQ